MATELAVGYVSIVAETSRIAPAIRSVFDGPVASSAASSGTSIGSKLMSGIGSSLKAGAISVGSAAGTALGTAIGLGLKRLVAIDDAQAKLKGLGNSAEDVATIMSNALASVKGTSFGLGEAASVAASAVAAGIQPGQELERTLKLVADAATIAGTDMGDMGSIFNKVAASGKLMGDDIAQLQDNGIPIVSLLAKELHVTAAEVYDLASKGKIGFADFQAAIEQGMGGAALTAANTFSGALKNVGAAMGRFGAALLSPGFSKAPNVLREITAGIDKVTAATPAALAKAAQEITSFGAKVSAAFEKVKSNESVLNSFYRVQSVFESLGQSAVQVAPALLQIGKSLATAAAATGVSAWQIFLSLLESGAAIIQALVGPLQTIGNLMQNHQTVVNAAAIAWLAFKTVPAVLAAVGTAVTAVTTRLAALNPAAAGTTAAMRAMASGASVGSVAMGSLRGAASSLLALMGGPLGAAIIATVAAISAIGSASNSAAAVSRDLANATNETAESYRNLTNAVLDSNGAVNEKTIGAASESIKTLLSQQDQLAADAPSTWGRIGAGFQDVGAALKIAASGAGSFSEVLGQLGQNSEKAFANKEMGERAAQTAQEIRNLGGATGELSNKIVGSKASWDSYYNNLLRTGQITSDTASALSLMRVNVDQAQEALQKIGPAGIQVSQGIQSIVESAGNANQALSGMKSTLQALGLLAQPATDSMRDLNETVDEIAQAAESAGQGVGDFGGTFDSVTNEIYTTSSAGRTLYDSLQKIGDGFLQAVTSGNNVDEAMAAAQRGLANLSTQTGISTTDLNALAGQFGLLPSQVEILLAVQGKDAVAGDLAEVKLKAEAVPKGATVNVKVDGGPETIATFEALGIKVTNYNQETGTATVTLDDLASDKLDGALKNVKTADGTKATVDVLAEDKDFNTKFDAALKRVEDMKTQKAEPVVTANVDQAVKGIGTVQAGLDGLKDKNITITTDYKSTGTPPGGSWRGGVAGRWRGGTAPKSLPGYAGGYRLPLTGPGTGTRDGFLGVSSSGMPVSKLDAGEWIINGNSSKKWNGLLGAVNRDDPRLKYLGDTRTATPPPVMVQQSQAPSFTDASQYHFYTVDVDAAMRTADRTQQRKVARYARR